MTVTIGDRIQQFQLVELAGEGGMGVVYRARDERLGRDVALKLLTRLGEVGPEYAERLKSEARTLAALNHPNVVTLHDIGDHQGMPFLVLEWIEGTPLSRRPQRGPLAVAAFLEIARQVADALAAAHRRGIVHRDVKPGNVLLAADGTAKLVDFGIALAPHESRRTGHGRVIGTVAYMSPEQLAGRDIGPTSDVYSFGLMTCELLAGRLPARPDGARPAATLRELRGDLPPRLVEVVERCLRQDPGDRYPDASALAHDLHALAQPTVEAAPTREMIGAPTATADVETPEVRFCTTGDGISIAYAVTGAGPMLVRVLGWFTHLEMEWQWPALRSMWELLAREHTVVRYDGRGIGLSDPWPEPFTEETRELDLEAVLAAVGAERPALFGISEGCWTAASYTVAHPGEVSRLILYGGYTRGEVARPGYDREEDEALLTLMRKGWGRDTPEFRQIFTTKFFGADAAPDLIAYFNEMQRAAADGETAARYERSLHERGDGRDFLARIEVPTLVIQCRDSRVVPFEEGRKLASVIPGARLVALPSGTHYFPTGHDQHITRMMVDAIGQFIRAPDPAVSGPNHDHDPPHPKRTR